MSDISYSHVRKAILKIFDFTDIKESNSLVCDYITHQRLMIEECLDILQSKDEQSVDRVISILKELISNKE